MPRRYQREEFFCGCCGRPRAEHEADPEPPYDPPEHEAQAEPLCEWCKKTQPWRKVCPHVHEGAKPEPPEQAPEWVIRLAHEISYQSRSWVISPAWAQERVVAAFNEQTRALRCEHGGCNEGNNIGHAGLWVSVCVNCIERMRKAEADLAARTEERDQARDLLQNATDAEAIQRERAETAERERDEAREQATNARVNQITQARNQDLVREIEEEWKPRAEAAEARLALARGALLKDGYFKANEVGDDIAPRIIERLAVAEAALERVRALHNKRANRDLAYPDSCDECCVPWPCPTIKEIGQWTQSLTRWRGAANEHREAGAGSHLRAGRVPAIPGRP